MKLHPFIQKLSNSNEYRDFEKKNLDAFLIAGFFVMDLESGNSLHQIDYYVPSKKKVAAFTLDKAITLQMLDLLGPKVPKKLEEKSNIDLDTLPGILEDEMKNRNITDEIKKIIAVVQNIDGKIIWNLNCILSGMSILNAHIEDESQSVLKMERKSLIDIMRNMPASEINQIKGAMPGMPKPGREQLMKTITPISAEDSAQSDSEDEEESEEDKQEENEEQDVKEKVKKLEMLESAIEKEKALLKKEEKKNPPKTKKQSKKK